MHIRVVTAIIAAALALAGCSSPPPDPKTEWTNSMKSAGFTPNAPHTYDEMFESAKQEPGRGGEGVRRRDVEVGLRAHPVDPGHDESGPSHPKVRGATLRRTPSCSKFLPDWEFAT